MEPTASRKPGTGQIELAFGDGEKQEGRSNEVQRDLSADPNLIPPLPPGPVVVEAPADARRAAPVWLQRLRLVLYVTFCIWLGWMLIVLPWRPVWSANALVADYPLLHAFLRHYFVRGLVSGLGFVDLWLGISEAVHYRDRKPNRDQSPIART